MHAVQTRAEECLVQVTYAPNYDQPLDVNYGMEGRREGLGREFFGQSVVVVRYRGERFAAGAALGRHVLESEAKPDQGTANLIARPDATTPQQSKSQPAARLLPREFSKVRRNVSS